MASRRADKRDRRERPVIELQRELRIILNVRSVLRIGKVLKGIVRWNEGPAIWVTFLKKRPADVLRGQLIADMLEGIGLGLRVRRVAGPKAGCTEKARLLSDAATIYS